MKAKPSGNIRFKNTFNEIVVANFGELQIVVPTLRQVVQKRVFSATVNVPHRIYDSEGWLLQGGDAIAALQNLTIDSIIAPETQFPTIERIILPINAALFVHRYFLALPSNIEKFLPYHYMPLIMYP